MNNILTDFLHLFFPDLCLICDTPLVKDEEYICLHCISRLPHTDYYKEKENRVFQLFIGKSDIQEASAFLHFEKGNSAQKLIHQLKYYRNKQLGYMLGRMAARQWETHALFRDIDMIIPVSLHPKRKRERGYNQAEYIALGIQSIRKTPINNTSLSRTHSSSSQVHKNLFDRWLNIRHLFVTNQHEVLQDKHILLVDDVVTSGSTLSACADALLTVPGVRVSIFALAAARRV
ncbi:MAG: ComF family protein [Tannerellaceae bacterium]|nr:ComF family protein [Tannerellaceae bacterium]